VKCQKIDFSELYKAARSHPKYRFWFKVKADGKLKPEEYTQYFENLGFSSNV